MLAMHPAEVAGWIKYDIEYPPAERMLAILWQTVFHALGGKELPHVEGRWLGRTKEALEEERQVHILNIMKGKLNNG